MDGMSQMYYLSLDFMAVSDARHAGYFAQMRDLATQYMQLARGAQRLQIRPSHVVEEIHSRDTTEHQVEEEIRHVSRARQCGRRRRTGASDVEQPCADSYFPNVYVGGSSSFDAGPSQLFTPQMVATDTPDPIRVSPIHHQSLSPHVGRLSISPIPIGHPSSTPDPGIMAAARLPPQEHGVEVEEDVPLARRRTRRTLRPTTCGTHEGRK